jgi:hypothetical protein
MYRFILSYLAPLLVCGSQQCCFFELLAQHVPNRAAKEYDAAAVHYDFA